MGFEKFKRLVKTALKKENIKKWLPLLLVLIAVTYSFFYGWNFDLSKPHAGGTKWADQSLYKKVADKLHNGQLPSSGQLHFTIGYSALGAVGEFVMPDDPFMLVSFALLIASVAFCFLAAKKLLGTIWAMIFIGILIAWDGAAITFNFASELFAIPWNNQLLFFTMSFYLWLFVTKLDKKPSWKLITVASLMSGYCFLTREETILFIVPTMAIYLFITKTDWKKWLATFGIIILCFMPQLLVKFLVNHTIFSSGREESYLTIIGSEYLQPSLLKRNVKEVIIGGSYYQNPKAGEPLLKSNRKALLQAAPWLWISPLGLLAIFVFRRYPLGLKVFTAISIVLILFYLSGVNMSGQKLQYHTLRYISAGFIILNLGVVIVIKECTKYGSKLTKKFIKTKK